MARSRKQAKLLRVAHRARIPARVFSHDFSASEWYLWIYCNNFVSTTYLRHHVRLRSGVFIQSGILGRRKVSLLEVVSLFGEVRLFGVVSIFEVVSLHLHGLIECPSSNQIPPSWRRLVHAQLAAGAFGTRSAAVLRMHIASPAKGERSSARPLFSSFKDGQLVGIDGPWWYLLRRDADGVLQWRISDGGLIEYPSPNQFPPSWRQPVHARLAAGALGTRSATKLGMHIASRGGAAYSAALIETSSATTWAPRRSTR